MKRLAFVAVVVACLVPASAAVAAGVLSGTYETTVRSTTFGGALDGTWTLKFQRANYTLADKARAKATVIHGQYVIAGNRITFMDRKGTCSGRLAPACPVGCPQPGTYKFNVKGGSVTFTEISDASPGCRARVAVLTGSFLKAG
jgi:hypothetical protein